ARVKVVTAGSDTAEGVLEYVSVAEAKRIREAIRTIQRQEKDVATEVAGGRSDDGQPLVSGVPSPRHLITVTTERVLLSGVFRFSLLYIALIFSALQFFEPDPEALVDFLSRGRASEWASVFAESPWTAALTAVVIASLLSWISGILVNLNLY
ncbi:MAG: hypothetical protein R3178_07800, partial [Rhodothermales bacterium]|nr:hypothetical protein [Rhodothermales bacterium]